MWILNHPSLLERINEVIYVKCSALCLVDSGHSINVGYCHCHHRRHHEESPLLLSLPSGADPHVWQISQFSSPLPSLTHKHSQPKAVFAVCQIWFRLLKYAVQHGTQVYSTRCLLLTLELGHGDVGEEDASSEILPSLPGDLSLSPGVHSLPWTHLYFRTWLKASVHPSVYFTRSQAPWEHEMGLTHFMWPGSKKVAVE